MKLKVIKRKEYVKKNLDGKVVDTVYAYYVAVRRWGFLWLPLKFYHRGLAGKYAVGAILNMGETTVDANFMYRYSTWFEKEADAISIKLDIMQHPNKYVLA